MSEAQARIVYVMMVVGGDLGPRAGLRAAASEVLNQQAAALSHSLCTSCLLAVKEQMHLRAAPPHVRRRNSVCVVPAAWPWPAPPAKSQPLLPCALLTHPPPAIFEAFVRLAPNTKKRCGALGGKRSSIGIAHPRDAGQVQAGVWTASARHGAGHSAPAAAAAALQHPHARRRIPVLVSPGGASAKGAASVWHASTLKISGWLAPKSGVPLLGGCISLARA